MTVSESRARYLWRSAAVVLAGVVLSGPVAVPLAAIAAPQPPWQDAGVFAAHFSWIQCLPYLFGFLIVGGFVAFMSGLVGTGREDQRPLEITAVALTGVFAALVFLNYTLQTAYVPQALDGDAAILAMATMANPRSLGWALELYGYGILGAATALASGHFEARARQGAIRVLFVANGVVSVAAAALAPLAPGWALAPAGVAAGAAWNLLIVVMMALVILEMRARERAQRLEAPRSRSRVS